MAVQVPPVPQGKNYINGAWQSGDAAAFITVRSPFDDSGSVLG